MDGTTTIIYVAATSTGYLPTKDEELVVFAIFLFFVSVAFFTRTLHIDN